MRIIQISGGHHAMVDDADYDDVAQYRWSYSHGYAIRKIAGTNKLISMHRYLLKAPTGMLCDHKNRNKLDNRRANLRLCTKAQNQQNQPVRSDSTTGVKGVTIFKHGGNKPYKAYIGINGGVNSLGYYKTVEEAAAAYNKAAIKHYGKFASINI